MNVYKLLIGEAVIVYVAAKLNIRIHGRALFFITVVLFMSALACLLRFAGKERYFPRPPEPLLAARRAQGSPVEKLPEHLIMLPPAERNTHDASRSTS